MLELVIPIVAIIGCVAIVIVMLVLRGKRQQMLHLERMAAIEKGIDIPPALLGDPERLTANACLLRGLIWFLIGVALAVFFVAMGISDHDSDMYATGALALAPIGVGIAYLVCYRKLRRESSVKVAA